MTRTDIVQFCREYDITLEVSIDSHLYVVN